MARILITGSADGLGLLAGQLLHDQGHDVVLHARNLSSGMHRRGRADLDDLQWERRPWDGGQAYSDSKLFDAVLAGAVARHRPDVLSNAVEPGWVPTKMGGPTAPDDLSLAPVTQAWLAVSNDVEAVTSGGYFYHQHPRHTHPAVDDQQFQDQLLASCEALTGSRLAGRPKP